MVNQKNHSKKRKNIRIFVYIKDFDIIIRTEIYKKVI